MCFLGVGYRLVVPLSRSPVVSWSCGPVVLLARYPGVLSHSQAFPGAPSQSRAFQSSRCLVVPESVWVGKTYPQSERGAAYLEENA